MPSHFDDSRKAILSTAREIYARLVYSHKTHEFEKDLIAHRIERVKWVRICTAVLTFVFATLTFAKFGDPWDKIIQVLTVLFGAFSAAQAAFEKEFVSEKDVDSQRQAAKELLGLRERFLLLIGRSYDPQTSNAELQSNLAQLTEALTQAYKLAPETTPKAYGAARNALQKDEALTFSDLEIDKFLPPQLRVVP